MTDQADNFRSRTSRVVVDDGLLNDFVNGKLDSVTEAQVAALIERKPELQQRLAAISGDGFLDRVKAAAVAIPNGAKRDRRVSEIPSPKSVAGGASLVVPNELAECTEYQVLKELGRGGMGVVYLAKYVPMDRVEVLKVLNDQLVQKDSAKQRFRSEMRAIGKLNHPAIATAYQQVPLPTQLVFSMEYVPGIDLHQFILKYHPVPIPVACAIAFQIAGALQHAHSKQTVHRDIKPSNVMTYKEDGTLRIKILDFGLAKATSERKSEGLTADGTMLGTPEYMAPEQALNAAGADIRADIYSLGCTLYHMLMGKPPFTGTFQSILMAHAQQEADYVSFERLDVPVELSEIITKMMAKEPAKRYQTPKQVAAALKPFAGQANIKFQSQIELAKIETHFDLLSPSRDTSVEQPSPQLAPATANPFNNPQPSVAESIADLKVEDRGSTKSANSNKRQTSANRKKQPPKIAIALGGLFLALILAGTLLLRTSEGTIVIEKLPNDAEVLVDQESAKLIWNEGKDTASVRVKPGTRQIEVRSGGIRIAGETVTIDRGDKETITVSVDRIEMAGVKQPPTTESTSKPFGTSSNLSDERMVLFDGASLDGWKGDDNYWRVETGCIVGKSSAVTPLDNNIYLISEIQTDGDFELEFDCKISPLGNSGVIYRGSLEPGNPIPKSYSIDIAPSIDASGSNYEEEGRGVLANVATKVRFDENGVARVTDTLGDAKDLVKAVNIDDWNHYRVVAQGSTMKHYVNGWLMSQLTDDDPKNSRTQGLLALQLHRGPEMEVRFKDIRLRIPSGTSMVQNNDPDNVTQIGLINGDFSDGLNGWQKQGQVDRFRLIESNDGHYLTTNRGYERITGRLYQTFEVPGNALRLVFFIHGGNSEDMYVALTGSGKELFKVGANDSNEWKQVLWDMTSIRGQQVTLEIVDWKNHYGWGHLGAYGFVITTMK